MTTMMSVIQQHEYGPPEVLELAEVPRPQPRPTEVLVQVRACGVNPVDWKTRAGQGLRFPLPFTPGWDVSGVVVEVNPGVTRFRPGDEVFGMPRFPGLAGCYAEFVTARARQLARKPPALSHVEAGGLPLAGLTAWQALVDTAHVGEGQRVLITAAGGGVGHLAVQIAKARGAEVVAVARVDKHAVLRELGADQTIDYTQVDAYATVSDLDLVFDVQGGPDCLGWVPAIRPGGMLLPLTGAGPDVLDEAARRGVRSTPLLVEPDGHGLESLAALADTGRLRVLVHEQLPLAQAAQAHRFGERGRTLGKLVLTT